MERLFKLSVNDRAVGITTDENRPLLDVLREDVGLTGTKFGCGEGECGACTVLMGNQAVRSCVTTVAEAENEKITTIEGLATDEKLHSVQQAFVDQQAMQCGYCVPGQIMTAVAFFRAHEKPSEREIISEMSGNICRCCNYVKILNALKQAAGIDGKK